MKLECYELVAGTATGQLLFASVGLSFWGGVDPLSGVVIDQTHPLHTQSISGKVLAIPNGRGSCTGSQVLLELVLNGKAPAAILLRQPDMILALGVIVAEEIFGKSIPIVSLGHQGFDAVAAAGYVAVDGAEIRTGNSVADVAGSADAPPSTPDDLIAAAKLELTTEEKDILAGKHGEAAKVAMRIMVRAASCDSAPHLLEISQAHIDGCTYIGPGGLRFAKTLVELGGKVKVPTTLNSMSVDRRRWKGLGVSPDLGTPAHELGDAYLALGCKHSFTCAPYLLDSAPALGEQVAWGESNAVVFANSVLGARTQKYADYLDICAALVARVPASGPHLDTNRIATVVLDATTVADEFETKCNDAFWPTMGYLAGLKAESRLPVVTGLAKYNPTIDDLKAFSAAFGTTASTAMYHIEGVTPEATTIEAALGGQPIADNNEVETVTLTTTDFIDAWGALDSSSGVDSASEIQLVAVGNPHLSLSECAKLAELCSQDGPKHPGVAMVATLGRDVFAKAEAAGYTDTLSKFGVSFINDTCWCMVVEPVIPTSSKTLITNSAKYAHYAPGLVDRQVRFSGLRGCVEAARTGRAPAVPGWLAGGTRGYSTVAANVLRLGRSILRK